MRTMHVKKGDMVQVTTGKVLTIIKDKNRVVVEKMNMVKKHQRPDAKGKGGVVEKEGSIHMSNVMLMCNKCNAGVRIGFKVLEDGKKVRICKKCKEILDE